MRILLSGFFACTQNHLELDFFFERGVAAHDTQDDIDHVVLVHHINQGVSVCVSCIFTCLDAYEVAGFLSLSDIFARVCELYFYAQMDTEMFFFRQVLTACPVGQMCLRSFPSRRLGVSLNRRKRCGTDCLLS